MTRSVLLAELPPTPASPTGGTLSLWRPRWNFLIFLVACLVILLDLARGGSGIFLTAKVMLEMEDALGANDRPFSRTTAI
jgi:hypothetical protein